MALFDVLKTRKSNRINDRLWQVVWERLQSMPAEERQSELFLIYVGTLLYAARYQASLAAGMGDTVAKSVALQFISKANYDAQMEDLILSVFSAAPDNPTANYAAVLNGRMAGLAKLAGSGSALQEEGAVAALDTIMALQDDLREQLPSST